MIDNENYDPSVQALTQGSRERWGNPEDNLASLLPFGFDPIDRAVYGVDLVYGDLVVIIGRRKDRKTTFVNNCIVNWMTREQLSIKPLVVYDILESGSPPEKVSDTLLCNLASRYLIQNGHRVRGICPLCNDRCKHLTLCPEFLLYEEKTNEQNKAIDKAIETMQTWPLMIYGPAYQKGHTRNLDQAVLRWKRLIDNGAKIFIVDHIQQYSRGDQLLSDYEKQILVVEKISEIVAEHGVVFIAVSQVSLTSVREARLGTGELIAAGGEKGTQEANLQFTINYNPFDWQIRAQISATRRSAMIEVGIAIDVVSGAYYGETNLL